MAGHVALTESYAPRPIRFLDLWEEGGWRLKVYGIAYRGDTPRAPLIAAAKRAARERLPLPAVAADRYGVGFLGIHDGRGANFVFVDWWTHENELVHHLYQSNGDRPANLEYATPRAVIACVWDLELMAFERAAWVRTVLANPRGPDLDAYLAARLDTRV